MIVVYAIFALYILFVVFCYFAFTSSRPYSPDLECSVSLSVVVCCKNEESRLQLLLNSIESQIDEVDEIIFANDNSTDRTADILKQFLLKHHRVILFSTEGKGKKNALKEAIGKASSEYILCIDADCVVAPNYFFIAKNFLSKHKPDLMIGGVKYAKTDSFFGNIQAIEFASLAATTAGMAIAGCPIMCNGANLAVKKEVWLNAQHHIKEQQQSGDDIFILHHIKRDKGKILYLKNSDSFVQTFASQNVNQFFEQRKRWVSKTTHYHDYQTIMVAIIVFLTNLSIVILALGAFLHHQFLYHFITIFVVKLLVDSLLLACFLKFSRQISLAKFILPSAVFYPFYVIYSTFAGIFGKFSWKN